jgi:biotin synthase-like enzyme
MDESHAGRRFAAHVGKELFFLSGAHSIFTQDKLLTTPNCDFDEDTKMLELLGLEAEQNYLAISNA